jgi:uncharacterized protein DUF6804
MKNLQMKLNLTKVSKLALAGLLFICLLEMPYGFYQLVRFVALMGFAVYAFQSYAHDNKTKAIIYGGLALLFQPFIKISLGREIWNIVDVIVGIGLLITILGKGTKGQP